MLGFDVSRFCVLTRTHTHRRLCALFALEREFAAIFYDAFDFVIFEFVLSNLLAKKVYLYLLSCVFIVYSYLVIIIIYIRTTVPLIS